jgi:hypothetical protein
VAIATAGAASTYVVIRSIIVANTHATLDVKVTIGIDTAATSADAELIADGWTVAPGRTEAFSEFIVLNGHASTPDRIYALADTANATMTISGVEIT